MSSVRYSSDDKASSNYSKASLAVMAGLMTFIPLVDVNATEFASEIEIVDGTSIAQEIQHFMQIERKILTSFDGTVNHITYDAYGNQKIIEVCLQVKGKERFFEVYAEEFRFEPRIGQKLVVDAIERKSGERQLDFKQIPVESLTKSDEALIDYFYS